MHGPSLYRYVQIMAMPNEAFPSVADKALQRYTPLIIWIGAILLAIVIPLKILGMGFLR